MNENVGRTVRLVLLGLVVALLLVLTGVGIGWFVERGSLAGPASPTPDVLTVFVTPITAPGETLLDRPTPKPTFTPLASPTALVSTPTVTPTATLPLGPTPEGGFVRFLVISESETLYQGPGDAYPLLGTVERGAELLVAGRTPDGLWWLVCCVDEQVGWMQLQPENVRVDGDVNTIDVMDVPVQSQEGAQVAPSPTEVAQPTGPVPIPPARGGPAPARRLDARLESLGVVIEPAPVLPGDPYWRVVEIRWFDEEEASGQRSIFVDVVDESGQRLVGEALALSRAGTTEYELLIAEGWPEDYGAHYPMVAAGRAYTLQVLGDLPSDRVHGLGLGDLDARAENVPVAYFVRFQRVTE